VPPSLNINATDLDPTFPPTHYLQKVCTAAGPFIDTFTQLFDQVLLLVVRGICKQSLLGHILSVI
jgi:hypothetical protein